MYLLCSAKLFTECGCIDLPAKVFLDNLAINNQFALYGTKDFNDAN